jgi:outer membrane protein assembly factor BamB
VFVMGKDGKPSAASDTWWTYRPQGTVSNNSLSMDGHRVYLLDRPDPTAAEAAKRRGETPSTKARLVALDLVTGEVQWETEQGVESRTELWLSEGVLLATAGNGMTGYDAATGKQLYARDAEMPRFPVLVRDTIIGEPAAWDLHTGAPKDRLSSFTQGQVPWNFLRSYGCGSIAAGPNLLLFRSGTLGFYDLAGDSGVHNFSGVRAGCYVNAIAANGLVRRPPTPAAPAATTSR